MRLFSLSVLKSLLFSPIVVGLFSASVCFAASGTTSSDPISSRLRICPAALDMYSTLSGGSAKDPALTEYGSLPQVRVELAVGSALFLYVYSDGSSDTFSAEIKAPGASVTATFSEDLRDSALHLKFQSRIYPYRAGSDQDSTTFILRTGESISAALAVLDKDKAANLVVSLRNIGLINAGNLVTLAPNQELIIPASIASTVVPVLVSSHECPPTSTPTPTPTPTFSPEPVVFNDNLAGNSNGESPIPNYRFNGSTPNYSISVIPLNLNPVNNVQLTTFEVNAAHVPGSLPLSSIPFNVYFWNSSSEVISNPNGQYPVRTASVTSNYATGATSQGGLPVRHILLSFLAGQNPVLPSGTGTILMGIAPVGTASELGSFYHMVSSANSPQAHYRFKSDGTLTQLSQPPQTGDDYAIRVDGVTTTQDPMQQNGAGNAIKMDTFDINQGGIDLSSTENQVQLSR